MERLTNFFNIKTKRNFNSFDLSDSLTTTNGSPQIGFNISLDENLKQITVKVIGARQLPVEYGSVKAKGYIVKVTSFPIKEKFETKLAKGNWPTFHEQFMFTINVPSRKSYNNSNNNNDILKGIFVCFTVYAVLDDMEEDSSSSNKSTNTLLKRFLSFDGSDTDFIRSKRNITRNVNRKSYRDSFRNRRTIGATTYNLERKNFTQITGTNTISTPDIWRNVKEISSGIQTISREGNKGCVELTMQYAVSEDGTNDAVEVSVTKFRCNVQTMQEHEKIGGQLYIKISAFESNDTIQKKKSDKFEPTISLKLEANTAMLRATVNKFMLNDVKILIRLLSRNILGKKVVLGLIEIDCNDQFWKEIVNNPGVALTKMVNFK